jgi:galactoside O-acetyltransferase
VSDRRLNEEELRLVGFKSLGADVHIDKAAIILKPEAIELGDHVRVDAFAVLSGGAGLRIGRNVHLAVGACVFGGGGVIIDDFSGISARAIIYSTNDDYSGAWLTGPTLPAEFTNVASAPVRVGRHVVVGAGSIVLPGVTVGDGAAVGALSLVGVDIEPFTIAAGVPAKPLKHRSREMLQRERAYLTSQRVDCPSLEIHVPISPTPSFFTMVACLAASVRAFAGDFSSVRLVVSVGEDCDPFDIAAAHPELAAFDIEWRWVDRAAFREHSYFATGLKRWEHPFECDYVLMADADIVVVNSISDLVSKLPDARSVAGCIATFPPFMARKSGDDAVRWPELFAAAGLGEPSYDHAIPGYARFYGKEHMNTAPPYYNFGFVFGARDAMNAIRDSFESDYLIAADYMKTDLAAQAGLCLSIVRHKLTAIALPVRYNFWATEAYHEAFQDERRDLRVMHYLAGPFSKHRDNESIADVLRWIGEHRRGTDETSRSVATVLERVLLTMDPV